MIYDCCLFIPEEKFLIAKPIGWVWSPAEQQPPFEIVTTEELYPQPEDYEVTLHATWGYLVVMASEIDTSLVQQGAE